MKRKLSFLVFVAIFLYGCAARNYGNMCLLWKFYPFRCGSISCLMILALLTSVGCIYRPPVKQNIVTLSVKDSSELVAAPMKKLGETRGLVQAKLGPPLSVTVEHVANLHRFQQIDEIYSLIYRGLVIRIYKVGRDGREMLLSVRMTQNYPGMFPDLIGRYRKDIVSSFGSPPTTKDETWEYDDIERHDSVKIEFKGTVVDAVQWNYYVD